MGARVKLTAEGKHSWEEVRSGGSYLSQSDLRLHFGLGEARKVELMEIDGQAAADKPFTICLSTKFSPFEKTARIDKNTESSAFNSLTWERPAYIKWSDFRETYTSQRDSFLLNSKKAANSIIRDFEFNVAWRSTTREC